ncbi:MAG: hypothetical protein NTV14_08375 [Coprothermobacterota bacterium]|nr:hypothetical protein [Coprothermobacterota bacterium]
MKSAEELQTYYGRLWGEVEGELAQDGEVIVAVELLQPPFPVEPLGSVRLILLRRTSLGLIALVSHENYRSPHREPRSEEPWRRVQDR